MELYNTIEEYANIKGITKLGAVKRKKRNILMKLTYKGKKRGYLDIYEANLMIAQYLNNNNNNNNNKGTLITK